jgi:hypothetical protein
VEKKTMAGLRALAPYLSPPLSLGWVLLAIGGSLLGLAGAVIAPYLAAQGSRRTRSGQAGSRWRWLAISVVGTAAGLLLALFGSSRLLGIDLWHPWYFALVTSSFVAALSAAYGLVYFAG